MNHILSVGQSQDGGEDEHDEYNNEDSRIYPRNSKSNSRPDVKDIEYSPTSQQKNTLFQKPQLNARKGSRDFDNTEPRQTRPVQSEAPESELSPRQSMRSEDYKDQYREQLKSEDHGGADPDFMQMLVSQSRTMEQLSPPKVLRHTRAWEFFS